MEELAVKSLPLISSCLLLSSLPGGSSVGKLALFKVAQELSAIKPRYEKQFQYHWIKQIPNLKGLVTHFEQTFTIHLPFCNLC